MPAPSRAARGRPPASSREMIADAACELFLERGYEATSITEITRRTGVSRSSFFNYFATKSEILWFAFDARAAEVSASLADSGIGIAEALARFGAGEPPTTLALAIVDARTMGVEAELAAGRAARQLRLAEAVSARLMRDGAPSLRAEIIAAGYAGAAVAAVWRWADLGAGRHALGAVLAEGLAEAERLLGAA
ncbi:TetR/AcrR family transcriptional regulator [Leucobacter allii]|uniref:TetR/AcrR family transcriptional regulator n=1 Tax=Leucobacter allii TaxID=2932247 RepID=UPI001FD0FA2F|nr:TetR/AcrR family transcriptional regulator [Leucobacter allii]UOR00653.1 TetR/AcrR family transcriptional regulator [Leucobacter allii]